MSNETIAPSVVTQRVMKKSWLCPDCGEPSSDYTHIKEGGRFGTWYCDGCGAGFYGTIERGRPVLLRDKSKKIDTLVLLRKDDLFLVVKGMRFVGHGKDETIGANDQYFYEQHTCPTNYLKDVVAVIQGDSADPHGLFEYWNTVDAAGVDDCESDSVEYWRKVFGGLTAKAVPE